MFYNQEVLNERTPLFHDLYTGTIPKRVPIAASIATEVCIEHAELPLAPP